MIGYVTMAMAVIPMISPSIGGFFSELYGWRAPFIILFVVGLALLALIYFDLGETFPPREFSFSQRLADYGSLLREPMVWGYFLCSSAASGAYFAFLGGAPFVDTEGVGVSPSMLGIYFATVAEGYVFGNFLSGRYLQRWGIEPMMIYGGVVACIGVAISLFLMTNFEPKIGYLVLSDDSDWYGQWYDPAQLQCWCHQCAARSRRFRLQSRRLPANRRRRGTRRPFQHANHRRELGHSALHHHVFHLIRRRRHCDADVFKGVQRWRLNPCPHSPRYC